MREADAPGICVLGHYERDYPRNLVVRQLLHDLGYRVIECHSRAAFPWRHLVLAREYWRVRREVGAVWMAEGGHRLVPLMRLWSRLGGHRLIFDPFISRYDTRVADRRLYRPGSLQAWIARWQDWSGCAAADFLVFDTAEHEAYFKDAYRLRTPSAVLEVAVDETVFRPRAAPATPDADDFDVLFYGTYIPLHGIATILDAAAQLRSERGLTITLVGRGQDYDAMRAHAARLSLPHVRFEDSRPVEALCDRIAQADLTLGVFGTTRKAGSVVPNKVVQCAAMAKPIITRDSESVRRYFEDGQDVMLVPPGDPAALAEAIRGLRRDHGRRRRLGLAARAAFEREFSAAALRPKLQAILAANGAPAQAGRAS